MAPAAKSCAWQRAALLITVSCLLYSSRFGSLYVCSTARERLLPGNGCCSAPLLRSFKRRSLSVLPDTPPAADIVPAEEARAFREQV